MPKPRRSERFSLGEDDCSRFPPSPIGFLHLCACVRTTGSGPFLEADLCDDCPKDKQSVSYFWGPEWFLVAALAVACQSECELHPTEAMKSLRPELEVGPGMVISQKI